jgi:hypothetical protein
MRTIRMLTAACGVLAFLGVYTIAFAKETLLTSNNTHSNSEFGSLQ